MAGIIDVFKSWFRREPPLPRGRIGPQQFESIFPDFDIDIPMPEGVPIPPRKILIPAGQDPEQYIAGLRRTAE